MLKNILDLLGIEEIKDITEEDHSYSFLKIVSFIFIAFNIIALVFYEVSSSWKYNSDIHFQVGFFQLIGLALLYTKYKEFGGYYFLVTLWAGMVYNASSVAGIFNPINYAFSMIVTMAIIAYGTRKAIIFAIVTTIFYALLYALSLAGYYPASIGRSIGTLGANGFFINYVTVLWFVVIMQALRKRSVDILFNVIKAKDTVIRKSEYMYRSIVEGEQNFYVMRYNINSTISYVNDALAKLNGLTSAEMIGKSIYDFVNKEDIEDVKKFNQSITVSNPVARYKYQFKKKDGSSEWQEWVTRIIVNGTTEFQTTGRSLKEQMESEKIIFQMGLNQAKMEFVEQLATEISHDIRTPLTVLNTSLYLLKKSDSIEGQKKYLSQIADVSTDLQKMIENLVSIIRIRDPIDEQGMTSIDLSKLVKRITEESEYLLKSNQKLEAYIEPDVVIDGNYNFLTRALNNLVVNAIQYTKIGGLITISLKSEANTAIVKVSDNGIGIPAADLEKVFDRLYRSNNAVTFFENGSGLGLYIVKMVVDKHQGHIDLKSEVDKGTTFTITLPNQHKGDLDKETVDIITTAANITENISVVKPDTEAELKPVVEIKAIEAPKLESESKPESKTDKDITIIDPVPPPKDQIKSIDAPPV
jgi:PAS domain S-box-containing protein